MGCENPIRHSKQECSAAERVIWKPAFAWTADQAGFQIDYSAGATFRVWNDGGWRYFRSKQAE
jgi:hypothetical protein